MSPSSSPNASRPGSVANPADVLILGSAQFSDRSWVNCQHVAAGLADRHRVLFVDSIGLRTPRPHGGDLGRIWRRLKDAGRGLHRPSPRLSVLSPTLSARVPTLLHLSIRSALARLAMKPGVVIAYLPTWAPVVERFPATYRLYHCVDEYAANPGVDADRIAALESRLLASCDRVLAVSAPLKDRLGRLHPHVELFPNVADVESFAAGSRLPEPPTISGLARPRILYLGNLASYKVDLALLERLAKQRPEWSWVLVGPVGRGDPDTNLDALRALPQGHLLGECERTLAPAFVAASDVCILPLRRSRSTESSAPLKIFEYLASGKPIVTTPIAAVEALAHRALVRVADSDETWIRQIEEALSEDASAAAPRVAEAMRHGWPNRIAEIEAILEAGP